MTVNSGPVSRKRRACGAPLGGLVLAAGAAMCGAFAPPSAGPALVQHTCGHAAVPGCTGHITAQRRASSLAMSDNLLGGEGDEYILCGSCKAAYLLEEFGQALGTRGTAVKCGVCGHSWFQAPDRVRRLTSDFRMKEFSGNAPTQGGGGGRGELRPGQLYVGNLPYDFYEEDMQSLFSRFGKVLNVRLMRDPTGASKGFGFVDMASPQDSETAATKLNGLDLAGRALAVRAQG